MRWPGLGLGSWQLFLVSHRSLQLGRQRTAKNSGRYYITLENHSPWPWFR